MKKDKEDLVFLSTKGWRIERKFNLSGFHEYHVLDQNGETLVKDTVRRFAIDKAKKI